MTVNGSRLRRRDLVATAWLGVRSRRARALLTATGIAIGIAAMVSVVGISASSKADLLARLDRLGTNLLQVSPGRTVFGDDVTLSEDAAAMVRRIGPVASASGTRQVSATVRRTDHVPSGETGGIAVVAAEPQLLDVLEARVASGTFLNDATHGYPVVVLGAKAAERLGIAETSGAPAVYLGGRWFTVVGILQPIELAPDIDRSALIGFDAAARWFGTDRSASTLWVRAAEAAVESTVEAVRAVLPATVRPEAPNEVEVTRPSDALAAKAETDRALTALLVALGGVALLVGGVGIANVMVIAVLERRSEIGLRRAVGATRRHVAAQFLAEAAVLAASGGVAGVALGGLVTAVYAAARGWSIAVPPDAVAGGIVAALAIGVLAGVHPAVRAARLAPADAVRIA